MRFPSIALLVALAACSFDGVKGLGSDGEGPDAGTDEPSDAAVVDLPDATTDPACVPPPAGLLAWWDGSALGLDRQGAFPGAIARGTPSIDTNGHVGSTTHFDNNEELSFSPAPTATTFTIEAWVRRDGDDMDFRTVYGAFNVAGVFLHEHRVVYWQDGNVVKGATTLSSDTYYHVAATWDGANALIYVNGTLDASTQPGEALTLPSPARSGGVADGFGDNQSFRGDVDELSLYARALTPAEIKAIADADTLGKCKE